MKNRYKIQRKYSVIILAVTLLLSISVKDAFGQAEVQSWGNITGIRKQGQLFEFESSLSVTGKSGSRTVSTGKEKQKPHFKRNGNQQIVTTSIDSLFFTEAVTDVSEGNINVAVDVTSHADTAIDGVYFRMAVPIDDYADSRLKIFNSAGITFSNLRPDVGNFAGVANGVEFILHGRDFKIMFDKPARVKFVPDTGGGKQAMQLYVVLKQNGIKNGEQIHSAFTVTASGTIDKSPVHVAINTSQPGRVFAGLGGNFRLQNPKTDPQVIDYCLANMRVAYGRVELPWRFWQPNKDEDPIAAADSGKLHPAVKKAMAMAHRLDSMGIPLVLSAWFPPDWAAEGKLNFRPVNGVWGNPLNKDNMQATYKSIADYVAYLKNKFGIEIKLFSFNESDLGINVRITPQEHDEFIKGCGAYFAKRNLKTKMLLGDNSDATTYKFIYPALNDPDARPYIGAVSFHSWRGCDEPTLKIWASAAKKLDLPLIVGEGSTDAAAYSYPDIFQEPTYALYEIGLYMRLLSTCQPLSILQWQLTADYSPLIGGGIFGNNEPLHPGQRYWNLKQLSITPPNLYAMPITSDKQNVVCAAVGDNQKGIYAVHLVNTGTTREVDITGLPGSVKQLKMYTTTKELSMQDGGLIPVKNGEAKIKLLTTSYTTLISE